MKNNIHFEHFRGNEDFVRRVYDWIDQMQRQYRIITTPFLTPAQLAIVEKLCGKQVLYQTFGGYEDAELKRVVFLPYEEELRKEDYITVLRAGFQQKFVKLNHRDILGALLNSGIKKEQLGDIIVDEDQFYVIASSEISDYIQMHVNKIKRAQVHMQLFQGVIVSKVNIKKEQHIVTSLRLDCIVSACAHISRKQAQDLIRGGLVKVNHVILEQTSSLCNNNSAISIRGYGRFIFYETLKSTKKDRFVIEIGKYM